MIEIIDLHQAKQEQCRVMLCQFNFKEFEWQKRDGLYFLINNDKIKNKVFEYLKIARHNSVDLVLFPELSIPEKLIEKIQDWSKEQDAIVICGSHYSKSETSYISRCPIIIKGNIYFSEKMFPAPIEKSPIIGEGIENGSKIMKFINSVVGDFSVLICSDYLEENLKDLLDLQSLDLLCIPAFQKNSEVYYNRMNIECENSINGIYLLYSNFIDDKYSDGGSAIYGIMDNIFTQKLKDKGYTKLTTDKQLFTFNDSTGYLICDINLINKRPFANRSIYTEPNFKVVSTNNQSISKDLIFINKIAHDDERYKRIDELYVPPNEYDDILKILEEKNIVFIVGDPGIGKTYTAAKLLKKYYEKGYEPIWFSGLEKEEREIQNRILIDFVPADNQIVYFEDPFGRTTFERRDSLFQVFSPLLDKLSNFNSKVVITSRKEIFEIFSKESLLESDVLKLKAELNIKNPSYNKEGLIKIFDKLGEIVCEWFYKKELREIVYNSILENKLNSPLSIRDFIFGARSVKSKDVLIQQIEKRGYEEKKVFALEILSANFSTKIVLLIIFFCNNKNKPFLADFYFNVANKLKNLNFNINSLSFNLEIRSQIGYRIEQLGITTSYYKFSHPIYEEAIASLIISDDVSEIIAKCIIEELAKKDTKYAYLSLNKYVIKYPEVSLMLFNDILKSNYLDDQPTRLILSQKLIATYVSTSKIDFFEIACQFYPLNELIKDINSKNFDWLNLNQMLNLCQRYFNNSPINFPINIIESINWEMLFENKTDKNLSPTKILNVLSLSKSLSPYSLPIFIKKRGENALKRIYFVLDKNDRVRLFKLFNGFPIQRELKKYKAILDSNNIKKIGRFKFLRNVIFSDKVYHGKIFIDIGAEKALKRSWTNLLPIGITRIEGSFSDGSTVAIFNNKNTMIGVGVVEYSSNDLIKLIGLKSYNFQEVIGYYHTNCAIRTDFLLRINSSENFDEWIEK